MAVRVYLRSPAALAWTLLGVLAVGAVAVVGWLVTGAIRSSVGSNPLFLGGLGHLLFLVTFPALLAVLAVVWLPFEAGVVHVVGRRVRGDPVSFRRSVSALLDAGRALASWLKTRAAVGPLADRLLDEDDVAPNEVVVGCAKFVVPALLLDAPDSLPRAVERANRVTPRAGHERLVFGGLGATGLAVAGVLFGRPWAPEPVAAVAAPLAVGLLVAGVVLTAALDAAWRASVYASQDLSEGFVR
jgi:uncharacterized membrane protein